MKTILARQPFQLSEGLLFEAVTREMPQPDAHELLVKVYASGVNPVDTKMRQAPLNQASRVLGFDAAGVVVAVGDQVSDFTPGDRVYYSGSNQRDGSNQTYQLVHEHYVAKMPDRLSFTEAAALPLTAITAYETLFDCFGIATTPSDNQGKTLLIINGAGGVGSIATQIAKAYGLTVITTASRPETRAWSEKMGADVVLNHRHSLIDQFETQSLARPDYIFCTYDTDGYYDTMIELVKPRGRIATIVAFQEKQDLNALKAKSITLTHEFMFARAMYGIDVHMYRHYLEDVTEKVESGQYQTTLNTVLKGLTPENIFRAHEMMEAQSHIGKLVIEVAE
ncbi:zinc-binding alcohol dehydrogenase family protein [Staphylococcus lutrae]|uniref:Zinc-type alcohol dehydrogenase-like protein n=1 Tax=Staphylococcus lutrae TaxID=155085 RepID=A0AAC9RSY0_9STAP|nr:zinc-binding alcohol dehydrogenase family protein [Staphylococcus lutrae]ARJ50337.1 alcohol dehydrogenase [Staphylococcus lutrae]PNZ36557.1 zinc-binding alcohol dehydrogenase family protein [Staphylococcus lutrae]